ncbi:uncharacterized protein LOC130647451 [Hydractinia symbiolongicarpus]|uniref:uncharacterized protein LOC130647451 n=1 Tax=Hydractinia symbiolongicarpus TaxID=13093 RepID=UPI00254E3A9C|nr:uncharacterized protein LOC130647451 [Hydractinia symbiolongicarpus]XP_057309298.1 uncharacterized protein LOC130647451 [Hydractinia symbiolongicarpus]
MSLNYPLFLYCVGRVIVEKLFNKGYSYKEIISVLYGVHIIKISLRQLKRDLAILVLFRRKNTCPHQLLYNVIKVEIGESWSALGYRSLHQKLKAVYNIQTSREKIRQLQHLIDPCGVALRRARRLQRRKYVCKVQIKCGI